MADEDEDSKGAPKRSALKIVLIIVVPLLLIVSTVLGLMLGGVIGGGGEEEETEEQIEEETVLPAIYISLDPAFVVNFAQGDKARFLQISAEVMTRQPEMENSIQTHMPVIRNNLVLLFSSQTYDSVSTLEGKEALREEALTVIQRILEEETGDPGVEAVYFTSFVMQ